MLFFIIGIIIIIIRVIRYLNNSKFTKLNLKDGAFEIKCHDESSILNRYLDEIIYFFEENKIDIIFIEDLDRFGDKMIFSKLRELNNLLNNSEQIKHRIVFIYALNDNLFNSKNRNKFFDIVIPIIPFINTSNSGDAFINMFNEYDPKHNISTDLINDISLYIDDMRLLINIYNEFIIYKISLQKISDMNKLLAMIVYKNIYSEDFVKLHNGEGLIHQLLVTEKKNIIESAIIIIEKEIEKLNSLIENTKGLVIHDENDLRGLYIHRFWNSLNKPVSLFINQREVSYKELSDKEIFNELKNDGIQGYFYKNINNTFNRTNNILKFSDIEKDINSNKTYDDRLKEIENKNKKEILNKLTKIDDLEKEKNKIKMMSFSDISTVAKFSSVFDEYNTNENKLIFYLLRNGYINEDYQYYISYFFEGFNIC